MPASIMVVNNSQTVLKMFEEILVEEGYSVHLRLFEECEIFQEIEAVKPDLLIVDCSSGIDSKGWELLKHLRMNKATQHLPVIVCSTEYHLFDEMGDYLATQRIVTLPKPFDIDDLLEAIQQAFKLNTAASDQPGDGSLAQTAS